MAAKFKKNDDVIAIAGKDKGRQGKILKILTTKGKGKLKKVVIEGLKKKLSSMLVVICRKSPVSLLLRHLLASQKPVLKFAKVGLLVPKLLYADLICMNFYNGWFVLPFRVSETFADLIRNHLMGVVTTTWGFRSKLFFLK